ncbi:MAG: LAGLIDADG family homing endonuclease [archaeon]
MYEEKVREDNPFVEKFELFLKNRCMKDIERLVGEYPQKRSLFVDFKELEHYDFELADELLVNPDVCLEAAQLAIKNIDVPMLEVEDFSPHIRVFNLPEEKQPLLMDISSSHIGKLISVEGVIRQVTDVLPKLKSATWHCTRCDATYKVPQTKNLLPKTPSMCSECKNRTFNLDEETSDFVDYQKIQIQEPLEAIKGSEQAINLDIYVSDDNVNKAAPGDRTRITGIIRLSPPKEKKIVYGRYLEAIHIEETAKEFEEVEISKEEEEEIIKLAKRDDVYEQLIQSIAPHIYGHEIMKESIALQLFGGVKKLLPNAQQVRGNIHILLVGDPGMAKSAILKATDAIAPKSIYVAGKSASGAGLSATAVKDEFGEGGWTLKAGALVLASGGMVMVDEFDKMEPEDRSAMHEALEQQSYHKDFEIMLADGSTKKIGELVDTLMEENGGKIIDGKDCQILPVENIEVLSTDFKEMFSVKADRVSRHIAPSHFIEVTYSNGRKITVTPEHPLYIFGEHGFEEVAAEKAEPGVVAPGVGIYETKKAPVQLDSNVEMTRKQLELPASMNPSVGRLLGYVASEGHSYISHENRYAEIGVSNTDPEILRDMESAFTSSFHGRLNTSIAKAERREKATKDLTTIRMASKPLYRFFEKNFTEILAKARQKRAPNKIKQAELETIKNFLQAAFSGDGFVDSERIGYATASYGLACDYQDMLLQIGVFSYIATEQRGPYHKVVVSGTQNMEKFRQIVVSPTDRRKEKIGKFILRSGNRESSRRLLPPQIVRQINGILKEIGISGGYFFSHAKKNHNAEANTVLKYLSKAQNKLDSAEKALGSEDPREIRKASHISLNDISQRMGLSPSAITYIERNRSSKHGELLETAEKMAREKIFALGKKVQSIAGLIDSPIKFLEITEIKKIENKDSKWVYDVTIEPTHTFISAGVVLHNTVSVAKAGIIAKFKADTTVLAAANPKYSRFDPYQPFIEQINLPATLISRFDLFFMIRDVLDRTKDQEIADHIIKSHRAGEMNLQRLKKGGGKKSVELEKLEELITPKISGELLKKFISYARQKIFPIMTDESMKEISDFYIALRDQGRKEGAYAATHRQLEGIIRLSEASARVRLSDAVERNDVERAIRLVKTSLQDLVTDPETGKIDIDIITSGQTHTTLSNLKKILGLIREKAKEVDMISIEEIIGEAKTLGIEKDKARDLLEKLHKAGDIYSPKNGFYKPQDSK